MLVGTGPHFQDAHNPRAVVQFGYPEDVGVLLVCDILFSTRGPCAGAIVVEWNVREAYQGSVAMFDSHIRIGGTYGTDLEGETCPKSAPLEALPYASFLLLHITANASGYFQNVWLWTADHVLDRGAPEQINVLSARGVLIEAERGPVWMYGTASEHQLLYQYSMVHAQNVLLAMIQTESPYFQGRAFARASQSVPRSSFPDPDCSARYASSLPPNPSREDRAIGLHMERCRSVYVLGAGLYSFFDSYEQDTLADHACQRRVCVIDDQHEPSSEVWLFHLATVGVEILVTIDGVDCLPERPHREGFCSTLSVCALRPTAGPGMATVFV